MPPTWPHPTSSLGAFHPHPDLLPGQLAPWNVLWGLDDLSLCSSYITVSVNTGNVVLFPDTTAQDSNG
jgi:hypothetical protein